MVKEFIFNQFNMLSVSKQFKYQAVLFDPKMRPTPGQSRPGSKDNGVVLHIPQSSRIGASSLNNLVSYQDIQGGGLVSREDAVNAFYSFSQFGLHSLMLLSYLHEFRQMAMPLKKNIVHFQ